MESKPSHRLCSNSNDGGSYFVWLCGCSKRSANPLVSLGQGRIRISLTCSGNDGGFPSYFDSCASISLSWSDLVLILPGMSSRPQKIRKCLKSERAKMRFAVNGNLPVISKLPFVWNVVTALGSLI